LTGWGPISFSRPLLQGIRISSLDVFVTSKAQDTKTLMESDITIPPKPTPSNHFSEGQCLHQSHRRTLTKAKQILENKPLFI